MENIVVIDGEISLQNHMDGEWDLNIPADGDPNVIIIEGGGQTYPHYSGSYTVNPSTTAQVLDTDGKVMDDDVTVQAVTQGSATTPATIITANPSISVSSGGLITATVSKTQQITPTVQEGYVSAGTAGNVGVSGSNTEQLSVQGTQTIYPSTSDQEIASGKFLTGKQTFKKVVVSGLSADKVLSGTTVKIGDADDDDRIASVVGTAQQGITPTGTKNITANGTNIDVYNYQYADVAVPNSYSAGDEGKVVSNGALVAQTSDTVTTNDTYDTTLINSLTVNVSGSSGYSIEDIIERNISGDIVYNSGTQTDLRDGLFQATSITSFSSTKITGAEMGRRSFSHNSSLKSVSMPNLSIGSNTSKMVEAFLNCTSLETLYLPRIGTTWGTNMCESCSSLTDVNIDACVTLPQATFRYCHALAELDLPNCTKIMNTAIESHSMTALILRASSVVSLNNVNALQNTPLRGYGGTYSGHVYVPSSLIASYKTASNWSSIYAAYNDIFKAIEGSIYE